MRHQAPIPYQSAPIKISAKGPTIFSKTGTSILQKDVHITQPGRLTRSDKASVFRDKNTGKISTIELYNDVKIEEYDKLLISNVARLYLKNNTVELNQIIYRLIQNPIHTEGKSAWGTASKGKVLQNGSIALEHATYSTCSPLKPAWQMRAQHLTLNYKKKTGIAKNVTIRLGGVPVLYTPYLSFPTNNARKSGILTPMIENASKNGLTVGLPYYWNMAPNYDMTITPVYYTKRQFQLNTTFQYLTNNSQGKLHISYLPNDKEFQRFKTSTINEFPNPITSTFQPYINALQKTQDYRGYLAFENQSKFNDRWTFNAQLNYVTDPYYLRDLGATINQVVANQLLNQVDIGYQGVHWNFTFLTQTYQTLHLIDQYQNPTVNQYTRLPELDTSTNYPDLFLGVNFDLNMQAVNFGYHSSFPPETDIMPTGQRLHIRPSLSRPVHWAAGYLTPSVYVDNTTYNLEKPQLGLPYTSNRSIPIFDMDSGLYFDRHFHLKNNEYAQTLEPRFFYLYVPYQNQDRYPVFDTQALPFTYEQLFALNRFTGFDRIQSANQVSLGLSSRILNSDNAATILKADIGIGYHLTEPQVCLTANCQQNNERWTPFASSLTYYATSQWSLTGNFSWDAERSQTNNAEIKVNYTLDGQHILGGGYTFVHAQPHSPDYNTAALTTNSGLYSLYFAWPLSNHWSALGYLYYNATERRPENYFAGVQYDTCCLAFRMIVNRTFQGSLPIDSGNASINQYQTSYLFQIQLKGLGSTGNMNPRAMLESGIPGYQDSFKY